MSLFLLFLVVLSYLTICFYGAIDKYEVMAKDIDENIRFEEFYLYEPESRVYDNEKFKKYFLPSRVMFKCIAYATGH